MTDRNVKLESLGLAAAALDTYISEVKNNIQKMKDAAIDCSDNMGSDKYSQKPISKMQDCAKSLSVTIENAADLKKQILAKIREIEASDKNF